MYLFSYFRDQELHEYHSYLEIFTQVQIIMFWISHFAVNIYPANTVLEVQIVNCRMPPGRGPGGTGGLLAGVDPWPRWVEHQFVRCFQTLAPYTQHTADTARAHWPTRPRPRALIGRRAALLLGSVVTMERWQIVCQHRTTLSGVPVSPRPASRWHRPALACDTTSAVLCSNIYITRLNLSNRN